MTDQRITAVRYTGGQPRETLEALAGEAALQIRVNGKPYTITMRSPGEDKMLVTGLLFTERLIRTREDMVSLSEMPSVAKDDTLIVDVHIKEEALEGRNLFNRSIASSASCGVCGKIELCDLHTPGTPLLVHEKLDIHHIPDLLREMLAEQSAFGRTGGSHAAAAFIIDGTLLSVKEDIGRHNAVDKVIGDLILTNRLRDASILFVSGRVSYEIVAKCAEAAIPFLLAVSAPSSLAVEFCRRKGITLIGFCRENRATVYAHEENVSQPAFHIQSTFVEANHFEVQWERNL